MMDSVSEKTGAAKRFWLTALVVGGVCFFVSHDWFTSRYEEFAPWSNAAEVQAAGGNPVKGAAWALIGLLGIYFLLQRNGRSWNGRHALGILMLFYLAWVACSLSWSIDPSLTLRRLAVLSFCVAGAFGIARQLHGREIVLAAALITGAYAALGVAAEISLGTFHPWEPGYRFSGTVHPNTQGVHLAILCLASVLLAPGETNPRKWRWLIVLGTAGFTLLLLTRSRTALAGFLAALAVLGAIHLKPQTRLLVACSGLGIVGGALLLGSMSGFDPETQILSAATLGREGEAESLTGRLPIWDELIVYAGWRPWQGYGYDSFWTQQRIEDVSQDMHWRFREAHNAYLDAVLGGGIVGAATLLAIVLLGIYRSAARYRRQNDPCSGFVLGMLVFGLIDASLESGMAGTNFITLIVGCGLVKTVFFKNEGVHTMQTETLAAHGLTH